jgi:hypothetical protein
MALGYSLVLVDDKGRLCVRSSSGAVIAARVQAPLSVTLAAIARGNHRKSPAQGCRRPIRVASVSTDADLVVQVLGVLRSPFIHGQKRVARHDARVGDQGAILRTEIAEAVVHKECGYSIVRASKRGAFKCTHDAIVGLKRRVARLEIESGVDNPHLWYPRFFSVETT